MKPSHIRLIAAVGLMPLLGLSVSVSVADLPGEGPRLGSERLTQEAISGNAMTLHDIRVQGRRIFSTPFNQYDGYGDGPMDPANPTAFGGRPTLQGNGRFLRVNGLDGQTCLECHAILSNATIPARFGVGGVGGSVTNAMFLPTIVDVSDAAGAGLASFDGRFINPPFLFGSGGIELLGKEMTADLQALKEEARSLPESVVALTTKGVDFGVIRYVDGEFDTSGVRGIDADLVVRPFGRKGEFPTTRSFDVDAMQFHFGMQPVEIVGEDVDADGDGVVNEILAGELSALSIFNTTLERPRQLIMRKEERQGFGVFHNIGCAECHVPALMTRSRTLTYSFPEVPTDPQVNVFFATDLSADPTGFRRTRGGGLLVPLYADLKRHDMGPELAESFGTDLDAQFTTARLWGLADTAPYMHDGRALTIAAAILMHGGEAQQARDAFADLDEVDQARLLAFLRTLRTPARVGDDLDE